MCGVVHVGSTCRCGVVCVCVHLSGDSRPTFSKVELVLPGVHISSQSHYIGHANSITYPVVCSHDEHIRFALWT